MYAKVLHVAQLVKEIPWMKSFLFSVILSITSKFYLGIHGYGKLKLHRSFFGNYSECHHKTDREDFGINGFLSPR